MRPGLRIWLLGSCALAQASCSDDDPSVVYIVQSDAGAGAVTPASDAATADASAANCSGQDALTQLLCQFGLQGVGQDAGAGAGQANIQDILNSFGGLAGIFGAGAGAGAGAPGSRDAGSLGGLFGGGAGGPFGAGATQPSATDCANATDQLTRLLCGFGRRDAGLGVPPPAATDSGAPVSDAGAPLEDAGAESAPDASSATEDAGDADAGDAAVASASP